MQLFEALDHSPVSRGPSSASNSVIERRNSIATSSLVTARRRGAAAYTLPAGIAQGRTSLTADTGEEGRRVKVGTQGTVLHQLHCLLQDFVGRGVSYVVYWKCSEEFGSELFRVCLTIYQEDLLQVRGLSYMLWMLDCYPALANMVTMMQLHQQVA